MPTTVNINNTGYDLDVGGASGSVTTSEIIVGVINKITLTTPATGSTITILNGKTFTCNNTLTLAGTDSSTLNIGTGGTLAGLAFQASVAAALGYTAANDASVVHLTGNETIAGIKTFSNNILANGLVTINGGAWSSYKSYLDAANSSGYPEVRLQQGLGTGYGGTLTLADGLSATPAGYMRLRYDGGYPKLESTGSLTIIAQSNTLTLGGTYVSLQINGRDAILVNLDYSASAQVFKAGVGHTYHTTFTNSADAIVASISPTGGATFSGGFGYATGSGGSVTQATTRTTGVTLNKISGAIVLVSAAGSATAQTFTVTNSTVAATDVVLVSQKSGTDKHIAIVTAVASGSFDLTFYTTGGTTTEQPVFNFVVIKGTAT